MRRCGEGVAVLLQGVKIAMLGGDRRELELARGLINVGAAVQLVGLPARDVSGAVQVDEVERAVNWADAVIMPMSGLNQDGTVYAPLMPDAKITFDSSLLQTIGPRRPLFIGILHKGPATAAASYDVRVIQWTALDEIAIANSIPTAEGAVQLAMEKLPITIHGSRSLVVGFGRCGMTLARLLSNMGSDVSVVARGPGDRARVREMGLTPWSPGQIAQAVEGQDVIFNTVPTLVLTGAVLERTLEDVVIIDIASMPAGTNFEAAKRLRRKAFHILGIPGKVAPVTAGRILAEHAPELILAELQRS